MKNYDVSRLPPMIKIGYDGENNWRPQSFDCASLLKNHPNGVLTLWLLPKGESQAFPVAVERDGNTIIWTPLSEEMTAETGALQIVCTDGTDVGKSAVVLFRVDESILPGAEHPAAVPSWATQTIERAESAADRAEEAAESIDIEALEARIAQAVEDYLEEHPVEAPVQSVNGKTGAVTLSASDVNALPADTVIPPTVTEQTVSGWGFTKNTGTYSKPSDGIPKTDLASDVQTSLGKADTALQEHQSLAGYATETYVQQQIDAIPDELPTVSASDNGKVLGVVNGEWAVKTDEGGSPAPLEIPITQSGSTYTTTATAEQIRAAKENSIFVLDGKARIKALVWFPLDEDLDMLIGMQMLNGTIMAVVATVTTNNVAITVELTVIPTATSGLTNDSGFITENDVKAAPIDDTGGYFTTDTVDGALQEIGAELAGVNTLIGTGVIT